MNKDTCRIPAEYLTGFVSKSIHVGNDPDPHTHSVTVPIYPVSTFEVTDENQKFVYSRVANPTRTALEYNLASLECAKHCVCASSGMAACSLVMHIFKDGERILCSENVYPGIRKYMEDLAKAAGGVTVEFTDLSNLEEVKATVKT